MVAISGADVLNWAFQWKNTPYVWGGTQLGVGVDCSGLVQQVYARFGIALPRTTYDQINAGRRVADLSMAQPGDLVFFDTDGNGTPSHVGIYMGSGRIFSADNPGQPVGIHDLAGEGPIVGITRPVGVISDANAETNGTYAFADMQASGAFGHTGSAAIPAARPTFDWWSGLGVSSPNLAGANENVGLISAFIKNDPELQNLYSEAVAGSWSQDQFVAHLQATDWWAKNSDSVRQMLATKATDPAAWNQQLSTRQAEIQQMATSLGVHLSANGLMNVANSALLFNWNDQQVQATLATYLKESQGGWYGGYAGQVELGLKEYAADMGIPLTDAYVKNAVGAIVAGSSTLENNRAYIQTQAALAFPAYADQINQGITVGQIAQPYATSLSNLWEQNPDSVDLNNPTLRAALQFRDAKGAPAIKPVYDFETQLRQNPRWLGTNNARESLMTGANQILSDMGLGSADIGQAPVTTPNAPTDVSPGFQNFGLSGQTNFPTLQGQEALSNPASPVPTGAASLATDTSFTSAGTRQG